MPRRVRELELPGDEPVALVGAATGAVLAGAGRTEDRILVDTFDGRLRRAGLVRAQGEPVDAEVTGGRALLPVVRVRGRAHDLVVLDEREKTVVRVGVEVPEVVLGPRERVALPARATVREVLGYDRAFERAVAALERAGAVEAPPLFDAAARAAGRDPEGVTGRVHADPDPSRPAGEAAHALLARLADVAEANVPGTRERLDDEFLHDLRVGVRRARSVLRELRAVFPAAELAHVRAELRWVQAATGPARDLDVQLAELGDLAAPLDARRRADLAPVRALLERRRDAAYAELRDALASQRFAAALAAWRALAPDPGAAAAARPVAEVAAERIRRVHRRMVRDGRAIGDASPDEALHDLRKRGKELRYLLELFGPLFAPEVVKPMVRALKDLQDVLGRFQDRVVQAELLEGAGRELARRRGGPEALMALGLVVEELRADQLRARGAFHARFDRFAAKGQRRLVAEAFA